MKDPALTIRTAYYNALNNIVQFNSAPVPFYTQVPSGSAFPYMYVSDFTSVEDVIADKNVFCLDCTMTVVCCMKYPGNSGGFADVDGISAQVIEIIRGDTTQSTPLPFLPDWQHVICCLAGGNEMKTEVTDGIIFSRILKFRHRIYQL